MLDLAAAFESHADLHAEFEGILHLLSARPDLHAFLLLERLVPGQGGKDMVSAAEHDVIYLSTDCAALAQVITDAQVQDLRRCGVRYDEEFDCLAMFV